MRSAIILFVCLFFLINERGTNRASSSNLVFYLKDIWALILWPNTTLAQAQVFCWFGTPEPFLFVFFFSFYHCCIRLSIEVYQYIRWQTGRSSYLFNQPDQTQAQAQSLRQKYADDKTSIGPSLSPGLHSEQQAQNSFCCPDTSLAPAPDREGATSRASPEHLLQHCP